MLLEILLVAFIVMLISLSGIIFLHKTTKKFLESKLSFLISFSAGVFLVTAVALMLEVFEMITSAWIGVGFLFAGYALAWAMHLFLPETHHHHDTSCSHTHGGARKLVVGDAIHNVADGVVLSSAFVISPVLGLTVAASIMIHEFLQEISEFFVLKQSGYSVQKALIINFAISSTILVGVIIGYFALAFDGLEAVLLGLSAGFFLHVVVHDLLPKRASHKTRLGFLTHLNFVVGGSFIMLIVTILLTHYH